MTFRFRFLASFLAPLTLAIALPAAAGDVDTHLDRARGRAQVVRSSAGNATPSSPLDAAMPAASLEKAATVAATSPVATPCTCDARRRDG